MTVSYINTLPHVSYDGELVEPDVAVDSENTAHPSEVSPLGGRRRAAVGSIGALRKWSFSLFSGVWHSW